MSVLLPDTRFQGATTVVQRVALVIWWAAATLMVLGVIALVAALVGSNREKEFLAVLAGALTISSWVVGRAVFFILTGR